MAIDKQTIEKIKDAANIVDVVSEFVTLRKSGSNYKGLCPFHNEKTPSFIVSPARGTCHCFGCGRGGNPIGFIMEHEQVTYPEALRWLAKKYHIEIRERELSDEERKEQSLRESMFIVNEWAATYFENILHNHVDGVAIGMQYFRSRGFRDDVIRKFRLGFDLPDRQALAHAALQEGYQTQFLLSTGICYQNDHNELIDRYANRVIFPWVGVSGKIVGFGGRVLDARTKGVNQKYVNSPDSEIYHKDHAKRAIAKEDNVYMVEGYTDVISMHQCGIENVVANSGTALSVYQIQMLHRFTNNITLLYDGDAAGIHAALRGTDMLLLEGMNLKVLLLPNNEDPDSVARQHTAEEFKAYIETHATDFIRFKTALLLDNETDPLKRSEAINSIVMSISMIQNPILRDTYLHDCAQRVSMNEMTLINQMNALIRERKASGSMQVAMPAVSGSQPLEASVATPKQSLSSSIQTVSEVEKFILQLIIKCGNRVVFSNVDDGNGNIISLTIAEFIQYNLGCDNLSFSSNLFNQILREAVERGVDRAFQTEPYFVHHNDIQVSTLAIELAEEKFKLSESQQVKDDEESLRNRVLHLMLDFRRDYVEKHIVAIKAQIAQAHGDQQMELMAEYQKLIARRNKLAKELGSNIIV